MTFTHPLARTAHVGSTAGLEGKVRRVLVIITGLQLEKDHKNYKETQVQRLSDAALRWLGDHEGEAEDFMLMNRPKKWAGDKD
ncbi:MAG: hypothetical protein ACRYGP_24035 [Janthinobacterium lividum]